MDECGDAPASSLSPAPCSVPYFPTCLWLGSLRIQSGRSARIPKSNVPSSDLPRCHLASPYAAMNPLLSRITVEPGKCGGRPCIRGYRLRVKDVLELLAHGASWEEILADYPFLEADDIRACLEYAAAQNDHVVLRAS